MNVYALKPDHIADFFPFLGSYLIAAERRSPSDVDARRAFEMGIKGEATFWIVLDDTTPKGLIVTRIEDWPRGAMCRVLAAGGKNMNGWLKPAFDRIEEHAKANDCVGLVVEGRRGWGRVLGLEPARYVYEMEIA